MQRKKVFFLLFLILLLLFELSDIVVTIGSFEPVINSEFYCRFALLNS